MRILVIDKEGVRRYLDCGAVVLFEVHGNPIAAAMDLPSNVTIYSDGRDPEFHKILDALRIEARNYVVLSPCRP